MEFARFAHWLYGVIGAQQTVSTFVRTLFENIITEEGYEILNDLDDDTFRNYYNGKNGISRLAKNIVKYVEPSIFEFYIDNLPGASVQMLAVSFQYALPDITPYNAGDKLAALFVSIITEAAGGKQGIKTEKAMNAASTPADVTINGYEEYLTKAMAFYREVKTLLYAEKPRDFREFYVCNHLSSHMGFRTVSDVTIQTLRGVFPRVTISGTGGIGKTMMMRHLLFDCAEHYKETDLIPILLLLRNYKDTFTNLADVLYQAVCEFTDHVTRESFDEKLAKGKFVILLDGFDETVGMTRYVFQLALTNFIKKYHDSMIVMTTRPFNTFAQIAHFTTLEIEPFRKEQALALIDKLDFHDQEVKEAFKVDLDKKLYDSHKEFTGNPLLLTIMLMTYDAYGDVPAKRHIFYRKAYEVMARLHDTTKGTYVRPMHTGLDPSEFAEYFAKFCAVTYREGILEFTEREFCYYMNEILKNSTKTCKDFLSDLTDNLCLLYKEGERYYFIHRSFQEYFCAVFISSQMDDDLQYFGEFFETQENRTSGDLTFDMLYNMIPSKIDRYILLPHLQQLWNKYDSAQGYQGFLTNMYGRIYITKTADSTYVHYGPTSFLYDFVIHQQDFCKQEQMEQLTWPPSIALCQRIDWNMDALFSKSSISYEQATAMFGSDYWIYLDKVYADPDNYADLIAFIESDKFPLKQEYEQVGTYIKQLEKTFSNKPKSGSWKDWLKPNK